MSTTKPRTIRREVGVAGRDRPSRFLVNLAEIQSRREQALKNNRPRGWLTGLWPRRRIVAPGPESERPSRPDGPIATVEKPAVFSPRLMSLLSEVFIKTGGRIICLLLRAVLLFARRILDYRAAALKRGRRLMRRTGRDLGRPVVPAPGQAAGPILSVKGGEDAHAAERSALRIGWGPMDWLGGGIRRLVESPLAFYVIASVLIVLPIKMLSAPDIFGAAAWRGRILGASETAAQDFLAASRLALAEDFSGAEKKFTSAGDNFAAARAEADILNGALLSLMGRLPFEEARLAAQAGELMAAGRLSAGIGAHLSSFLNSLAKKPAFMTPAAFLADARETAAAAAASGAELERILSGLEPAVWPAEFRPAAETLKDRAALLGETLRELEALAGALYKMAGIEHDRRYLIVFQNNAEMRATGGFIGSYALLDLKNGQVKNLEAPGGGSYDTEGGLRVLVAAPEPLWLVRGRWYFWDANWWPDWPTSARKLEWFYGKSGGPSVDGVFAVTPTVVERLLALTGPVDLTDEYGVTITADNFWLVTQKFAENQDAPDNKPKKIIGDLAGRLIGRVGGLEKEQWLEMLKILESSLREKHILLYFNDPELDALTARYGWNGAISDTAFDYLSVIHTNIAGGKTDRVIRETITHEAAIAADGAVTDTLTIIREHAGGKNEEFVGVGNNDYLRVYVPAGSELLEASGFERPVEELFVQPDKDWPRDEDLYRGEAGASVHPESGTLVYEEFGKTVFANWTQIDPGETKAVKIIYRLPFRVRPAVVAAAGPEDSDKDGAENPAVYALLAEKQPGATNQTLKSRLTAPSAYRAVRHYPAGDEGAVNGWDRSEIFTADKFYGVMYASE